MKYIISLGEILIDVIPTTQIRLGEACYSPYPGGAIANVAVAIARLGGSSRFMGGVAEDEFGRLLMQVLADNHVDTQYVHVVKEASTAVALVTLHAGGQRNFTFFRQGTADSQLQAEDLNWSAWHDAAVCHVGGVLLSTEPARSATLAAMDHTRSVGSIVSFDVNIRPTLWTSPATIQETITKAVERADILKLSVEEAEYTGVQGYSPSEPLERSKLNALGVALLEKGPRLVIITLGANGALLMTAKHQVEIPSLPVRPVDTTGAGDAFIGAVLYTLVQQGCSTPSDLLALSEHALYNLGSMANQVAGLSTTRYGGISSFPYMHEISGFSAP
ncbi:MAG: carbohydrate kinase [Chloroflexi bacterium]|nr:MAG: carbohydrate kinase [Chloroflexota bacterium]